MKSTTEARLTRATGWAVLAALAVLVAAASMTMSADYDLWWHLRLGASVAESGIYRTDSFSYTFAGAPQFCSEWLADLVIYLFHSTGGMPGLNVFKALMVAISFFLLYKAMRAHPERETGTGLPAAALTLAVVLFSIRFRLFIRPYLFSFVFFSLFLYLLTRYERERKPWLLYLLPVIEVVWANTSKGAFYGTFLTLIFAIGFYLNNRRYTKPPALALAAVFGASLISPSSFALYTLPLGVLIEGRTMVEQVGEHQPLSAQLLWGYGLRYTFAYQVLVAGSLAYVVLMGGFRRVFHLLIFAAFFVQSLMMVRMIDFFSLASAVLFVRPVERLMAPVVRRLGPATVTTVLAALIIAATVLSTALSPTYRLGFGVKPGIFPEGALAFMERVGIKGRLFNSYSFGGYILWRSPDRKVFIDGRGIGALYPVGFYNSYHEIVKDADKWAEAERKWGFNIALVEYDMKDPRFPSHLNENPDWAVVYWDGHSVVYLKRTPGNRSVIERFGYRVTRPAFYDFSYLDQYARTTPARAAALIEREISLNPSNQEPRLARAYLLFKTGRYDEALAEMEASLALRPDLAFEHSAIALILNRTGKTERAKEETLKALERDPFDPGAKFLKKKLGL